MRLLTNIERTALERGMEKGLQKGREEGRREERIQALKVVLKARFGALLRELEKHLDSLTTEQLEPLLSLAATEPSLKEFSSRLQS